MEGKDIRICVYHLGNMTSYAECLPLLVYTLFSYLLHTLSDFQVY